MKIPPDCPYCKQPTVYKVSSDHLYSKDYGPVYECEPCKAWVGCHKTEDGTTPLGVPATQEIRRLRTIAHYFFDRLWAAKMKRDGCTKVEARTAAYKWLAAHLNIPVAECHMALMHDREQLERVIAICTERPLRKAPGMEAPDTPQQENSNEPA